MNPSPLDPQATTPTSRPLLLRQLIADLQSTNIPEAFFITRAQREKHFFLGEISDSMLNRILGIRTHLEVVE